MHLCYSPDGNIIASGCWGGKLIIWDGYSGEFKKCIYAHNNWINSVGFSPDSQYIISGSDDKTIKIWTSSLE